MSVYKLAGTGTGGTENGLGQLDIMADGVITGLHGDLSAVFEANADTAYSEISFLSVNSQGVNDTRGSLCSLDIELLLVTGGYAMVVGKNTNVGGLAIVVNAGERLWLHSVASSADSTRHAWYIYVEDGVGLQQSQRRR